MDRKHYLLAHIDPATQHGLEIGALCNPIVPPAAGRIEYVDHLPTDALREKYAADPNVDIDRIVPVSYVWGASTLSEAVGDRRFDYVIASHVIEHVPDPIGWLREIAAVLKPGGVLSLAIPDKRWTFDCRREVTSVSALIESYFEKHRRPTIRHCVDHIGEVAAVPGALSTADLWQGTASFSQIPLAHPDLLENLGESGLRAHFDALRNGTYHNVHCSVFTPFSFVRIVAMLARLGMLEYRVASFQETPVNDIEFFVTLEKLPASLDLAARVKIIVDSLPALPAPLLDGEIQALLAGQGANLRTYAEADLVPAPSQDDAPTLDENQKLARVQQQLALARAAQRAAEAEAMLQRSRAAALEADVSRLLTSTSWRITAPLRAVKRLLRGKS